MYMKFIPERRKGETRKRQRFQGRREKKKRKTKIRKNNSVIRRKKQSSKWKIQLFKFPHQSMSHQNSVPKSLQAMYDRCSKWKSDPAAIEARPLLRINFCMFWEFRESNVTRSIFA